MTRSQELKRVWTEHANVGHIPCLYTDYNFLRHPKFVNERPEGHDGYDWFGVHWTYDPANGAPSPTTGVGHVITDLEHWREQVKFPDLASMDWKAAGEEETANWDRENKISVVMLINGIFERSHHLMGFENALAAMYEEPEEYAELLDAIADYKVELMGYVAENYKPDVLMMHDDYGTSKGMIMSPDMWREFFKPRVKRLVDKAHSYGIAYEHHSCGHVMPIIGDLIEIGVDAINPLQRPTNDIEELKRLYGGKITLVGGFSSQTVLENPSATDEEKFADVRNAYEVLGPGGGYAVFPVVIDFPKAGQYIVPIQKELGDAFAVA